MLCQQQPQRDNERHHNNKIPKRFFRNKLYDLYTGEHPHGYSWKSSQIQQKAFPGDSAPNENMKWEFKEVDDHEKPGCGANEAILGDAGGKQVDRHDSG